MVEIVFQLSIPTIYYNITTSDLIPTNAERYKTKHAKIDSFNWLLYSFGALLKTFVVF